MGMLDLADHILAIADQSNQQITNLKLQKIMFFTIRDYLLKSKYAHNRSFLDNRFRKAKKFVKKDVYDTPFYAWLYGPVDKYVYFHFCEYGGFPIEDTGKYVKKYRIFDDIIKHLLRVSVFELIAKSHQQSVWKNNKKSIVHDRDYSRKYTIKDIIN